MNEMEVVFFLIFLSVALGVTLAVILWILIRAKAVLYVVHRSDYERKI